MHEKLHPSHMTISREARSPMRVYVHFGAKLMSIRVRRALTSIALTGGQGGVNTLLPSFFGQVRVSFF